MSSEISKIIFLDIDGVLNQRSPLKWNMEKSLGNIFFHLDSDLVKKYNQFIENHSDVTTVLCSSCRMFTDHARIAYNVIPSIIASTPFLNTTIRYREILSYLESLKCDCHWIWLDDEPDTISPLGIQRMGGLIVKVTSEYGLSDDNVKEMDEFFSESNKEKVNEDQGTDENQ